MLYDNIVRSYAHDFTPMDHGWWSLSYGINDVMTHVVITYIVISNLRGYLRSSPRAASAEFGPHHPRAIMLGIGNGMMLRNTDACNA